MTNPQAAVLPREPSWWLQEALSWEGHVPAQPLPGPLDVDVAIVGGGYTGLWTALELAARDPHLRIVLLEADLCGSAASGKNGGFCHGYWTSLGVLRRLFGDSGALAVAKAGSAAQKGIARFVEQRGEDVWWRPSGVLKISATPSHDVKIDNQVAAIRDLGAGEHVVPLTLTELRSRCDSPLFRKGAWFPEGATVQPARLARALRRAAIDAGVKVYERTVVRGVRAGNPNVVSTSSGAVRASEVVLATNAALAGFPATRQFVVNFSSYMVITQRAPELLEELNWTNGEGISDGRMFIHYFRTTPDGRIALGTTGAIGYAGRTRSRPVIADVRSAGRAHRGLLRYFPSFSSVGLVAAWGGPVDVASDHAPYFGTMTGTRIHYGFGYSGHGVNPTYIGGKCLASLVLREKNEWTELPLCTRAMPALPPEPFRYLGGSVIREAILACEEAEEEGRRPGRVAEFVAALPARLHLRIGARSFD